MRKFISFIKGFHFYKRKELLEAAASFTKKQSVIFLSLVVLSIILVVILLAKINSTFMVSVPVSGGTITEGIIGVPTLVNPVGAITDADKDLTALVYSGLMRKDEYGEIIPDLASSYEISPDGKNYTFILKDDARFHDGEKVTADDVVFTIEKIKDPIVKSPRRMSWDGVSVYKTDDKTVVFTLAQPYISFLDNTTIGILPVHLWKDVNVNEFNINPLNTSKAIGSGPYKIVSVLKNKDGIPEEYKLKRFTRFALGKPLIKRINIVSFSNEKDLIKALTNGSIDQAGGVSSENSEMLEKEGFAIHTATLPRIFGIFFNSEKNKIFSDENVVRAIDMGIDRQEIVNKILGGYGSVIHNPVPGDVVYDENIENYERSRVDEAVNLLDKAGWKLGEDGIRTKGGTTSKVVTKKVNGKTVKQTVNSQGPLTRLSFSIITGDTPELRQTAELIKEQLAKIGVEVNIDRVYETGQLNQLIRAREYEALFFGQVVNHESDLYSFWHSSQKRDPGLNIAMYNNPKVDSALELIQKILKPEDRMGKYENLKKEFDAKIPAILIYSPEYIYATSPSLNNIYLETITISSDRLSSVYKWAADRDNVWKIFTK